MTYSYSVHFARPTGTTGGMVCGNADGAMRYALDRSTEYQCGARVECWSLCDGCQGAGRVAGRRRNTTRTCSCCKGREPQRRLRTWTIEPGPNPVDPRTPLHGATATAARPERERVSVFAFGGVEITTVLVGGAS